MGGSGHWEKHVQGEGAERTVFEVGTSDGKCACVRWPTSARSICSRGRRRARLWGWYEARSSICTFQNDSHGRATDARRASGAARRSGRGTYGATPVRAQSSEHERLLVRMQRMRAPTDEPVVDLPAWVGYTRRGGMAGLAVGMWRWVRLVADVGVQRTRVPKPHAVPRICCCCRVSLLSGIGASLPLVHRSSYADCLLSVSFLVARLQRLDGDALVPVLGTFLASLLAFRSHLVAFILHHPGMDEHCNIAANRNET